MDQHVDYYFYLWQNHVGNTCFGITSDIVNRQRGYEGHTGIPIDFKAVWSGPETLIRDLEKRMKGDFHNDLFATFAGKYEWILSHVPYEQIENYVKWEVENTYRKMILRVK